MKNIGAMHPILILGSPSALSPVLKQDCFTLAVTGLAALFVDVLVGSRHAQHPIWRDLATLGLLRVYPAPMLFIAFIVCAFIAPTRHYRRLLLGAAAIESPAAACSFYFIAWLPFWAILHTIL